MLAGRLEQVERAVGVDREVRVRVARRPVVRGLRGGVDDQLDLAAVLGEQPRRRRRRRGCRARRCGSSASSRLSRSLTCAVEASGPKSTARMSFSIPTTSKPASTKSRDRLGADQPAGSGDYRLWHRLRSSLPVPIEAQRDSSASSCSADPVEMSASTSRGRRGLGARRLAEEARAVASGRSGRRPGGRLGSAPIGTSLPVSSRQSSVVSSSERLPVAAAADVDGDAAPALGLGELLARPGRRGRRRGAGRAPACRCRRSRCSRAGGRSGG